MGKKSVRKTRLRQRAKRVKMLILDIDGVMTDGKIIYGEGGRELKCFNVLDGMGLALLHRAKIKLILISAKASRAISRRAKDIKAEEVRQGVRDKLAEFGMILKKYKMHQSNICFVGDDLVDLPVLKRAGFSVAVANACGEAKKLSHYVTNRAGGQGAVREVVEIILRAQGKWREVIKEYLI